MSKKSQDRAKPKALIECFEGLRGPRMDRTRLHKLVDILVIGLCSQLSGGEGLKDMPVFGRARQDWLKNVSETARGHSFL